MTIEQFIEDFEDAVEDVEPGTLTAETVFKSLKSWDSLAVLTATDTVDLEYGVILRRADFESSTSLLDLFNCIQQKRAQ